VSIILLRGRAVNGVEIYFRMAGNARLFQKSVYNKNRVQNSRRLDEHGLCKKGNRASGAKRVGDISRSAGDRPAPSGKDDAFAKARQWRNGARAYVTLDDPEARMQAKSDPALFLQRYQPPVTIDEIQ
jgi:hypothetical protein